MSQPSELIPGYNITFGELHRACAYLKSTGWSGFIRFDEAIRALHLHKPVTPAPPEASHRALREKVQGLVDEFDRVARRHREQGTDEYANAYEDVVVKLRAALSTGMETTAK
jgi:hypothetical protein